MGTRVYVGRLHHDVRERDLENFFKGCGTIREILLKNGFAFVEFDDYRDADDAVYELSGKQLFGERVSVERARGTPHGSDRWRGGSRGRPHQRRGGRENSSRYGPPTRTQYRVIVENLSSGVSWQDLKDYMRQAGEVTFVDAHKKHPNEGIVEFATYADMKDAIEKLDDTELNGRRVRLSEDKSCRRRGRSVSRSRFRSRSRSRSKHRSRSRSRSRCRSKSRSKSVSRSRSRSQSHSKSRSRSHSRSRSPSMSHSKLTSRSRSKSKSKSRSRSNSHDRSKSGSRSRSKSKEKSKSNSKSQLKGENRSPEKNNKDE